MRRSRPARLMVLSAVVLVAVSSCTGSPGADRPHEGSSTASVPSATPRAVGDPQRYVDPITDRVDAHTDVAFASVPELRSDAPIVLSLDWYEPAGDTSRARPAIVWIHGGGFFQGSRAEVTEVAEAWAARGYVTVNIDYRIDPGSRCMQLNGLTGAERAAETARCREVMTAAMHDAQAAVRWVRADAEMLGVDPSRIAVAGFSAGALTAVHVAQRSDDPGTVGAALVQPSSVSAALAASGCSAELSTIGADDAPVFLLASEFDRSVPFSCTTATEQRLVSIGTAPATLYFMGQSDHALTLYRRHRAEVDAAWATFLVDRLDLR